MVYFSNNVIKKMVDSGVDPYGYAQRNYVRFLIQYCIDSQYRKSVSLANWLHEIVSNKDKIKVLSEFIRDQNITHYVGDNDATMLSIYRWVLENCKWTSDTQLFNKLEYWQEPNESVAKRVRGKYLMDCENGALLIYVIARYCGIPANRLMIFCGDTSVGGHAWLGYKAHNWPVTWFFMDWCAGQNIYLPFDVRDNFYVTKQTFTKNFGLNDDTYKKMWFCFNELSGHKELEYKDVTR